MRSAWLANLLTHSDSFCFHEALVRCGSMSDLIKIFESVPKFTQFIGDAEPSIGYVPLAILESFPGCRMVFVHRPIEDCVESAWTAMTWDGSPEFDKVTKDGLAESFRRMSLGVAYLAKALPVNRKLMVLYRELDSESVVKEVWNFCCPNTVFPSQRYELLRDLRVTQISGQAMRRNPTQPFARLIEQSRQEQAT